MLRENNNNRQREQMNSPVIYEGGLIFARAIPIFSWWRFWVATMKLGLMLTKIRTNGEPVGPIMLKTWAD